MCVCVCVHIYTHKRKSTKQNSERTMPPYKRETGEVLKLFQRWENGSGGVEQRGKMFQDEMASELRSGGEVRCEEETQDGHFAAAAAVAKSLQLCPTLCDPRDGSPPGFPSLGLSRQEHWSGLPFPSPMHESEK